MRTAAGQRFYGVADAPADPGTRACVSAARVGGDAGDGASVTDAGPVAVTGGLSFSSLATGDYHTCGLTSSGAAYCWGDNSGGELGRGVFSYSTVPVKVLGQP